MALSPNARALILHFEGCDQPGECVGGLSGVTVGIGDDLGQTTVRDFKLRWAPYLHPIDLAKLADAVGKKSVTQDYCNQFKGIRIRLVDAMRVFEEHSIPQAEAVCRHYLVGFDALPPDVRGALTSLAYNRGLGKGDPKSPESYERRREVRAIIDACANAKLTTAYRNALIATAFHSMERLWTNNTKSDGDLNDRAHACGKLVDPSCECPNRKD